MWFSDIRTVKGTYRFQEKFKINKKQLISQKLTSVPNKSKDKWWILIPLHNSNEFTKYQIGRDTVIEYPSQKIGIVLKALDMGVGQAQYSPNAKMFAINTEKHGVLLYDFNNETGKLSNFRKISYPNSENVASGLCFSPNGRFIYVTTAENVYQIDVENENEIFHVGHYRSFDDYNWPVGLGVIFSGPDCRLYVSPGSTSYFLHVILNPNEKGGNCNFIERAIDLPSAVPHDLPNIPQYRYITGCDTSIVFPFETSVLDEVLDKLDFKIFPNPSFDYIEVVLTKMDRWKRWEIRNIEGEVMLKGKYRDMKKIDISSLSRGMYFLKMTDKTGIVRISKFVKE